MEGLQDTVQKTDPDSENQPPIGTAGTSNGEPKFGMEPDDFTGQGRMVNGRKM